MDLDDIIQVSKYSINYYIANISNYPPSIQFRYLAGRSWQVCLPLEIQLKTPLAPLEHNQLTSELTEETQIRSVSSHCLLSKWIFTNNVYWIHLLRPFFCVNPLDFMDIKWYQYGNWWWCCLTTSWCTEACQRPIFPTFWMPGKRQKLISAGPGRIQVGWTVGPLLNRGFLTFIFNSSFGGHSHVHGHQYDSIIFKPLLEAWRAEVAISRASHEAHIMKKTTHSTVVGCWWREPEASYHAGSRYQLADS